MKHLYILGVIITFCILAACKAERKHAVQFYHWKTNVTIDEIERSYFSKLESNTLYMRFFDLDLKDNRVEPISKVRKFINNKIDCSYIPVIFITNRSFANKSEKEILDLAQKTFELIERIAEVNQIRSLSQIQIDCDWTNSTRHNYFYFLEKLKQISKLEVSCTIRLHQVKYTKETGVPPVDKGFLMCYATTNPQDEDVTNSILDMSLLKDYTNNINDYPLELDIALPLYSWGIIANHLGKIQLINKMSSQDIKDHQFKKIEENTYEAIDDFFFKGLYINQGFTIRVEEISPKLLREAKAYLDKKIKSDYEIVYYHLDKPYLERFTIEDLK